MSLTLQYELVQHTLSSIGSNVIRYGALAFSQSAQIGEPAISENAWDDPDGTWDIKGYREFFAYETAAPSNNRLVYNGFVLSRTYHRDASFRTGAARRITVETGDGNTALGWRILFDGTGSNSAKRPAETAGDRIRWLVNSSLRLPSLYAHPTIFANPTNAMDANDYRGQRYNDVLADVANTTGYNFFVQYDEGRQRSELLFLDPGGTDYTSTLSLSNSLADINSTTVFAPSEDAELHRDPSRIAGGVYLAYDGGSIYQTRQSIYDEFALVDQTAPLGNVKSETKARAIATRYQDDNDEEDDRITCSFVVPAASVNLVRQGMQMLVRFTHFPGWETSRYARVLKRSVIQEDDLGQDYYRIALELSPAGPNVPRIVQSSFDRGSNGDLIQPDFAQPVTPGNTLLIIAATNNSAAPAWNSPTPVTIHQYISYQDLAQFPGPGSACAWSIGSRLITSSEGDYINPVNGNVPPAAGWSVHFFEINGTVTASSSGSGTITPAANVSVAGLGSGLFIGGVLTQEANYGTDGPVLTGSGTAFFSGNEYGPATNPQNPSQALWRYIGTTADGTGITVGIANGTYSYNLFGTVKFGVLLS